VLPFTAGRECYHCPVMPVRKMLRQAAGDPGIAPYRLARRRPELRDGTVPEVERLGEPALRPGGILNRHVVLRPAR
jgi:hypothetical protein